VAVLLFLMTMCAAPERRQILIQGDTMGTTYSVKIITQKPVNQDELAEEIQTVVDRLDHLMSNWKPDSDVSRFGEMEPTQTLQIAQETAEVIGVAKQVWEASDGALDPTISPLIELWGFGTRDRSSFPDPKAVAEKLTQTGLQNLSLDKLSLRKSLPGLTLNLGAIAKGYALDQVAERLEALGYTDYLVEIGRELRAKGHNLKGVPWRVAIEDPDPDSQTPILKVVALDGKSIATSGDYRQFFTYQGQVYSHIIDPRTGYPVQHGVTLASVIAPNCALADAWSTTLMILPPEVSIDIIEKRDDLECLLVLREEDGRFSVVTSEGMGRFFISLTP